jgi:hypothetical protein
LYRVVELGPVAGGPGWGVSRGVEQLPTYAAPFGLLSDGRLVVNRHDLTLDEMNTVHRLGSRLVQLPERYPTAVAMLPDDRVAVVSRDGLSVCRPGTAADPVRPPAGAGVRVVAADPTGRALLTADDTGVVRVWGLAVASDGLTTAAATGRGNVVLFDLD